MLRDNIISRHKVINGITYSYDNIREKWLSLNTYNIFYGLNRKNINSYRT